MADTLTKRGGKKVCYQNNLYTRQKVLSDGSYRWQCVMRGKTGCKGALKASENGNNPVITSLHNHAADSILVELNQHRSAMKTAMQVSTAKPQVSRNIHVRDLNRCRILIHRPN